MNEWLGLVRSLAIYGRAGHRRSLRRLYRPFVPPGSLVFDVGAHVGDRTSAFLALGARVVAVEPQPLFASWLRRTVGRRSEVQVLEVALGRAEGRATLAVSRRTPTVSTLSAGWRAKMQRENRGFRGVRWDRRVEVRVTTLEALVAEHGTPAFCKVDVEGWEAEVLAGLDRPLPALSIEFVQGGLDVARACVARLSELGPYRYNAVAGEHRAFLFERWEDPMAIDGWLERGADGLASGDVYARLDRPGEGGA